MPNSATNVLSTISSTMIDSVRSVGIDGVVERGNDLLDTDTLSKYELTPACLGLNRQIPFRIRIRRARFPTGTRLLTRYSGPCLRKSLP